MQPSINIHPKLMGPYTKKSKIIETMQPMFSDHIRVKLKINNKNISPKHQHT